MTKTEKLDDLLHTLAPDMILPHSYTEKWRLFRSLVNIREPIPVSSEFLIVQDQLLQEEISAKGVTSIDDLSPVRDNLYLWQGDITTLQTDAIVNAANSGLLGCFIPCHACIDNAIHTYAGIELRLACHELMKIQNHPEPAGRAKITPAYNLPSSYVIHTVGPIIVNETTEKDCETLSSCYRSCMRLAKENKITSIAFCCISTGEFHFPNEKAAKIAVKTVSDFLAEYHSQMKVVFNVFKERDYEIYQRLLTADQ